MSLLSFLRFFGCFQNRTKDLGTRISTESRFISANVLHFCNAVAAVAQWTLKVNLLKFAKCATSNVALEQKLGVFKLFLMAETHGFSTVGRV